jgi:tetratricopeptide (TPR) repeat protein
VVLGGCATIILLVMIFYARVQTSYWRNSESLWTHTLACTSDNDIAHNGLGNVLLEKGSVDEAIIHYQMALQIKPNYAEVCYNLGSALLQKGEVAEATTHFQMALQIKPDFAEAHNNLGSALLQKGRVNEAITHFQMALQIKPDYADAHHNLGCALLQKGRVNEAITHFQMALQIKPDFAEAQINLSWILATSSQASLRNGTKAVELAQQANRLTGGENPNILTTLAAAYAEAGRFSEATKSAQRALQLAEKQSNIALANAIRSQMKLYQAGIPFHDTE